MATSISREAIIDRRQPAIRWSAVFAGTALAVGVWLLLQVIGMGIGLAAIDTDDAGSLRGVSIGTSVWTLLAPLIAMFVGGMFAGKLAGTYDRKVAGGHGLVVWALTSVLGVATMVWMISAVAGGTIRAGMGIAQGAGSVAGEVADHVNGGRLADELGIDTDSVLGPVNQKLRAQGKPTVTAGELHAALRGVARGGLAHGRFDRELFIDQLAANTRLSRADAADVANQVEDRVTGTVNDVGDRVEHATLQAADAAGKALAALGASLLLGLATSVLGAMLALHDWRRKKDGGGHRRFGRHTTEPGTAPHQTAPYPPPAPVIETPPEIGG